jgi:hypothetical protein
MTANSAPQSGYRVTRIVRGSDPGRTASHLDTALHPSRAPCVLFLVYSKDCGFCRMMQPAWETAVQQARYQVPVLEMESEALATLPAGSSRLIDRVRGSSDFSGVPFVGILNNGSDVIPYQGDRSVPSLLRFVRQSSN